MKFSIITINYNNASGLQKTIDSVITQTNKDYEWIIIDGGSIDGSKEIIEENAAQGCFAYWCSEQDRGIYHAMNKGITKANGEYYIFLNSGDCFFSPNVLQRVADCNFEADILYGDSEMVNADGSSYTKKMPEELSVEFFFRDTIIHQATFIKNSVFQEFPYDENLRVASDRKLWFQCLLSEKSFIHIPFRICAFDLTGIGTVGKMKGEEKVIIDQLFPAAIQKSIKELADYKYAFPQLPKLIRYINYRRLYKRIIIFILDIFEWKTKE